MEYFPLKQQLSFHQVPASVKRANGINLAQGDRFYAGLRPLLAMGSGVPTNNVLPTNSSEDPSFLC